MTENITCGCGQKSNGEESKEKSLPLFGTSSSISKSSRLNSSSDSEYRVVSSLSAVKIKLSMKDNINKGKLYNPNKAVSLILCIFKIPDKCRDSSSLSVWYSS